MDGSQAPDSGFSPHVLGRLNEAAMKVSGSNQAQTRQPWNNPYPGSHPSSHFEPNARTHMNDPPHPPPWGYQTTMNPHDQNAFPPLHASQTRTAAQNSLLQRQQQQQQQASGQAPQSHTYNSVPPPPSSQFSHGPLRGFNARGRGRPYRGRGNPAFNHAQQHSHGPHAFPPQASGDFNRPSPVTRKLFTPGGHPQFSSVEDQRAFQRMIMNQSDFLNHLASQSLKNQLTTEEQQAKESFRKELEAIAKQVIREAKTDDMDFNPEHVQLALYGSLGSGFAVAGSDMDLLLALPKGEGSLGDIEMESRRRLEKALLDAGIGARLLENTRVPILRVCQKPSPELLRNLRDYRLKWEEGLTKDDGPPIDEGWGPLPSLTDAQAMAGAQALADLDSKAHEVPLPASPVPEAARLEFVGDCGIQCDINFSNYVALHNTRLLKTYGLCDPRVRQVGVFVKNWAKARDINTPYHGTLSSYGYILMVLHYLMNVVSPPIIPNLQLLATQNDTWDDKTDVELVEGHDVRFIRDMNQVHTILKDMPRNHESVGALLRGFFWYYANPQGFHWMNEVVSIRTRGGRRTKRSKDWTEAKRSSENQSVRLRYLVAIEDPFEIEHNVARTVGHHGIIAIRGEFRRAWEIIENIQYDGDAKMWFWLTQDDRRFSGYEMTAVLAEKRGDLLRKDTDHARQRMRQMRLTLEAKEKALQEAAAHSNENSQETTNGTFQVTHSPVQEPRRSVNSSSSSLIAGDVSQITEQNQTLWSEQATMESKTEDKQEDFHPQNDEIDWDKPFDETEAVINPEFVSQVVTDGTEQHHFQQTEHAAADEVPASELSVGDDPRISNQVSEELPLVKILWARETKAGRWLCWRDAQIIKGTWTGVKSPVYQRLDKAFPYNPSMTVAELAQMNKTLCSTYGNSLLPRTRKMERENQKTKSQSVLAKTSTQNGTHVEQQVSQPPDAKAPGRTHPTQAKYWIDVIDGATATGNASASRTEGDLMIKRDNLGTKDLKTKHDGPFEPLHARRSSEPPGLHPLIEILKSGGTQKDSPVVSSAEPPRFMSSGQSQPDRATEYQQQPSPKEQPVGDVIHQQQPSPKEQPIGDVTHQGVDPPTSHSDVPSPQQLREEDPNITTIPRSLGFMFDPRQLADLEVIRLGGNGCARGSHESKVKKDHEFGSSGATVAHDFGSNLRKENKKAAAAVTRERAPQASTTRWQVKGDDMGLRMSFRTVVER